MGYASIRRYVLTVDLGSYGIQREKDEASYEVVWDAPVSDPENPKLWKAQRASLLAMLAMCRKDRTIPIVAVFVPKAAPRKVKVPKRRRQG